MKFSDNKFRCPCCGAKLSWHELFKFSKGHLTICEKCHTELVPEKTLSFSLSFSLGALAFVIPAQTTKSLIGNSWLSFVAGLVAAALFITALVIYLYFTTTFKAAD